MPKNQSAQPLPLDLEVREVERRRKPGCSSSSTFPHCTCPVYAPTGDIQK